MLAPDVHAERLGTHAGRRHPDRLQALADLRLGEHPEDLGAKPADDLPGRAGAGIVHYRR
jgi:hypothetical protein